MATLLFGCGIVGAAFAISWAAEAAEHDIPRALALTVVALLAVLPEYAVDIVFAYKAGSDPTFAPYAVANMTGSEPSAARPGLADHRRPGLARSAASASCTWTAAARCRWSSWSAATMYSFSLPLRGAIAPLDSVMLILLFAAYAILAARQETHEPDLIGPAAAIGAPADDAAARWRWSACSRSPG